MNEAIVLFMGGSSIKEHGGKRYVYYTQSCAREVAELGYHSSWDALMPVIRKIKYDPTSCIRAESNGIPDSVMPYLNAMKEMNHWLLRPDIEKCHKGVYQFIQWFNKQQSNEQPK